MANEFKLPTNPYKFGSIDYDNWNYEHPEAKGGTDVALDAAKQTLGSANEFADQTGSADIAALDDRLAALRSKPDMRGLARRITEPLAGAGNIALATSVPASINPVIGGALATGGGLAVLPDLARRLIAPEADENAPGGVELGLSALGAAPGLRGLRGMLKEAAPFIGPLGDLEGAAGIGGRALAYEGAQAGARPAERMSVSALQKLMETPSFANLPRGQVSMARIAKGAAPSVGEAQGAQSFADAVRGEAARVKSPFERMAMAGEFAGDRSVRGISGLETEGPGGLSAVSSGRIVPERSLVIPSVEPMDPYQRLAARSVERFGRRFQRE
jgi:hypothetical protein